MSKTDWKSIEHISSVGATSTGRIIGRRISEAREHDKRSYSEAGSKYVESKVSKESRISFFETSNEFTCGHGRLYWTPCRNCNRDKESAKEWLSRLSGRIKEVLK